MEWRTVKSKKGMEKFEKFFSTLSERKKRATTEEMCRYLQEYRQKDLFLMKEATAASEAADKAASMLLRVPRGRKRRPRRP